MEIAGIEPATLCMLSIRAANCAKPPDLPFDNTVNACCFLSTVIFQGLELKTLYCTHIICRLGYGISRTRTVASGSLL
jgi:hypothetical protein